jgi:DNA processing protein
MNIYDYALEKIAGYSKSLVDCLIFRFRDSETLLHMPNDELVQKLYKAKLKEEVIKKFLEQKDEFNKNEKGFIGKYNAEIEDIRKILGAEVISFSDKNYPSQLRSIRGIPLNLYVKGDINFDFSRSIAIVGTRNVSTYAREKVAEIAKDLAREGFCIISGLARGVDGQAQSSTVAINKKTIAVLPYIANNIYPSEHRQLANDILLNGGALISENISFNRVFQPFLFTERNRLISGLSRAVLIIEGSYKSGSLSQYNHAKRQNKIIFTLKPIKDHEGTFLPKKIVKEGGFEIQSAKEIIKTLNEINHPRTYDQNRTINYYS